MNSGISGGDKLQNLAKILSSAVTVVIGAAKIPRFMGLLCPVLSPRIRKKNAPVISQKIGSNRPGIATDSHKGPSSRSQPRAVCKTAKQAEACSEYSGVSVSDLPE